MEETRRASLAIAADYDAVPYESPVEPGLLPRALLGWGAVFGCPGALGDVLDLGCGAGVQLEAAGAEVSSRLVGVDISSAHCARAQTRLAKFGARGSVLCRDALDLTAEGLGQLDLIHASGLIFVVPPEVRAHLLKLIAACLRPGGVALISHYAGPVPQARAELHRLVREEVAAGLSPRETVARGRAALARLAVDATKLQRLAAQQSASQPDATFFHEVFNPFFTSLSTGELERALASSGLGFLGHAESRAFLAMTPAGRAADADAADQAGGGYHYALFGKGAGPPDIAAPLVLWTTRLRREAGELYRWGDTTARIAHAPTRTLLDAIAAAPRSFREAAPAMEQQLTAQYLCQMWQDRLVSPLRQS